MLAQITAQLWEFIDPRTVPYKLCSQCLKRHIEFLYLIFYDKFASLSNKFPFVFFPTLETLKFKGRFLLYSVNLLLLENFLICFSSTYV